VVIHQIDIMYMFVAEPEDDPMVSGDCNAPEAFQIASQRMQMKTRQVDISRFPEIKEGVEPKTLSEPLRRGIQNVPWPTPLSGRGIQGTASVSANVAVFAEAAS
jgi:hypothetical protein